jgi:hypothetical protein
MVVENIVERFGFDFLRRSSAAFGFEHAFNECYNAKIKTVLEIGTFNGITSGIMALKCDKVITIDIPIEGKDNKFKLWDYLEVTDKIDFYEVNSEVEKENLIKKLNFDFCFMDGDHCHYTYSDFMMVRKCGRVLFHEYGVDSYPVTKLVNSFGRHQRIDLTHFGRFALWTE